MARGRGDAAEVTAPGPGPSADEEEEERTARLLRQRRCLPGGFLIAGRKETEAAFVLGLRASARCPRPHRALSNAPTASAQKDG